MEEEIKVWFITGISRGLGKALAQEVLNRGDIVIGTTRDGKSDINNEHGRLHALKLDVSYPEQVKKTVSAAQQLYGRLDVVVNNAGYGLLGAVEEASMAELHQQFDVNFFGTLYVTQAVLPFLRAQRSGHILNFSSIAGLAPVGGYALYAASKFAVEGLTQSLWHELKPLGIKVTTVEPGSFRTEFLDEASIQQTGKTIEDYDASSGALQRFMQTLAGQQPGDPQRAASAIVDTVYCSEPPLHLVLGSDAIGRTRKMLADFSAELDRWQSVSLSTDFDKIPA